MAKHIKRKSFDLWNNQNPVLDKDTIGIISCGRDLGKFKKGDGVTSWRDLPYVEKRKPILVTGKTLKRFSLIRWIKRIFSKRRRRK